MICSSVSYTIKKSENSACLFIYKRQARQNRPCPPGDTIALAGRFSRAQILVVTPHRTVPMFHPCRASHRPRGMGLENIYQQFHLSFLAKTRPYQPWCPAELMRRENCVPRPDRIPVSGYKMQAKLNIFRIRE
jgi:hypothetical protein